MYCYFEYQLRLLWKLSFTDKSSSVRVLCKTTIIFSFSGTASCIQTEKRGITQCYIWHFQTPRWKTSPSTSCLSHYFKKKRKKKKIFFKPKGLMCQYTCYCYLENQLWFFFITEGLILDMKLLSNIIVLWWEIENIGNDYKNKMKISMWWRPFRVLSESIGK